MGDEITYAQLHYVGRMNARATLVAALLESKTVDLSTVNLFDPAAAATSQSVQKLKATVDMLMANVIQA